MNATAIQLYSAAQLARAAGVTKRQMLVELRAIPATGVLIIQGNEAAAWSLDVLPANRRQDIERRADALTSGSADAHAFITQAAPPWQPPVPLEQVAPVSLTKAATLRRALARVLELRNNPSLTVSELEAIGLEDYRREFGHSVTDRTLRALVKRTVDRDNCAENFNRLEIYLDGNPQRKSAKKSDAAACDSFAEMHDLMATFKSAVEPSGRERESLWLAAVKLLHARRADAREQKRTRVKLVSYLWRSAPWLAKSKNALRVALAEKYSRFVASENDEAALRDGREAKRGIPTAPPVDQTLIDNIVACATFRTGGRVSQAARIVGNMATELNLSDDLADLLSPEAENKSYVNRRVREAVRHEVRAIAPYVIGARALDTARASLDRSYNFPAGFCYSSDDATLPVRWYVPDGQGWFNLVRGQCLITIDVRSLRILGFSLQPDANYSSPVIHTNFTRVFSDFGVPKNLMLECGIWKKSKLITGGPRAQTNHPDYQFMPFSWAETSRGFGYLGVKIMHTIRARSKVVERVIGAVQCLMEAEPGYTGREERVDLPQRTKEQSDDVVFHRAHPSKYFYDFNQWEARLVEIFAEYNAEQQQGKILAGMSPNEAWEKLQSPDESQRPMLFDETCRHLLAHYRVTKKVGRDGVTITIGKKKWVYRSERLGHDKFKEVLCWFNPDEPSSLAITDLNMKHPYTVPLSNAVDAINPDPEAFATELERIAEYEAHGKARYQVLKANLAPRFRCFVPNRAIVETGQAMRQQREVIAAQKAQAQTRKRTVHRRAGELGLPASIVTSGREGEAGTARMLEAIRNQEKKKSTVNPESL